MTRKIFTFVTAHPANVEPHEFPRVLERCYMLEGECLESAFAVIAEFEDVASATEVFGIECVNLMITPQSRLQHEKPLADWEHWSGMQRRGELDAKWTLMAEGAESFSQRQDRLLSLLLAKRTATDRGPCAMGAAGVFLS